MDGHQWEKISESEVRTKIAGVIKSKKQTLWGCMRCMQSTITDGDLDPEITQELYAMEPKELDGTTVMNPLIKTCDEEMQEAALNV